MRAVSDTGPLIRFSWIDRLDLLDELFDGVRPKSVGHGGSGVQLGRASKTASTDFDHTLFDELLIPVGVWRELVPPGAPLPGVGAIVALLAQIAVEER